jgi:hypothetical protein
MRAINRGDADTGQALLNKGVDVDEKYKNGYTTLKFAKGRFIIRFNPVRMLNY